MKNFHDAYIYLDWNFHLLEASVSYKYWKEDDLYLVECFELRLVDQGKSLPEAINNLGNMIIASLVDAIMHGNIDVMLRELGFRKGVISVPNRNYYKQSIELSADSSLMPVRSSFPMMTETTSRV